MTCPVRTQPTRSQAPQGLLAGLESASEAHPDNAQRRPADIEMARVLKTAPIRMAADPSSGAIAQWKHGALHDVVEPMKDHVIMTYPNGVQRLERRNGKSVAIGTARSGVVTIIPAGSSARWDIPGPVHVVQLYLPHKTLERVTHEAGASARGDLLERTGHPDPVTSRLLLSAADVIESNATLDALFRQQLVDLLATRLLVAHAGAPSAFQPSLGGLSPTVLRHAIERLRSDSEADVSLAALAADAGLSRFHFCRAFKESTGLSPHAWLRQHRLEQAMNMLRDTDDSVVSIAAALGYASQTAFAAAFRKLTGETPSDWRRRMRERRTRRIPNDVYFNGEDRFMSKPNLREVPHESPASDPAARRPDSQSAEARAADAEMARVLGTTPFHMALDSSGAGIAHWKHEPLHDVVEPMTHHVVMAYNGMMQRMERRTGKSVAIGTFRPGVLIIIPEGSSSRWDIPKPVDVVQLYLPRTTLQRVADETGTASPIELLERTAHPDPITSRLLLSASDVLEGNDALDTLFRQQLTDVLATRLLAAHTGAPATFQPTLGGLSPTVLGRAIERLRSDSDTDISLSSLASDAGLSRFHFCRAFKESTGLSPHAWLRQHQLERAMQMLRDPELSVVSVAAALGYSSQTAFAAAFRKLTGETPSDWRKRAR